MSEEKYLGKPLAYLDQNILDAFLKADDKDKSFIEEFLSKFKLYILILLCKKFISQD